MSMLGNPVSFLRKVNDSPIRCAMTGIAIRDSSEGVWDDGEWISWSYINEQIDLQENGPAPTEENEEIYDEQDREPSPELLFRILHAKNHYEHTLGRISPDWGPIGEAYIAERFEEVKLCSRNTEGHDARLGNALVEIKTITPHKRQAFVQVKRAGNFTILAVVRVSDDNKLEVRFIPGVNYRQGMAENI
jgi:hypothetical protein